MRPGGSEALVSWGTLTLDLVACDSMVMGLDTLEGSKISRAVQLVGIVGLECS